MEDVDLAERTLTVHPERGSYNPKTRTTVGPKSSAGARRLAIAGVLLGYLVEHRSRRRGKDGLVFARGSLAGHCRAGTERDPFDSSRTGKRAEKAWSAAGIAPVCLHDCRHTFASLAIHAMARQGVFNPKLLQAQLGHSSIKVTYDRYGHLFPGQEREVAAMLDDLLAPALTNDADNVVDLTRRLKGAAR